MEPGRRLARVPVRGTGRGSPRLRTEAEAVRKREAILEHNRTPPDSVRDDVTFWTGTPEQIAETMAGYRAIGFDTFLVETPAPYDDETMELLMHEVKPMVEAATAHA